MRVSTPGLFSTRIDRTCLRPVRSAAGRLELLEAEQLLGSWLAHDAQPTMSRAACAGRDHRVHVLLAR